MLSRNAKLYLVSTALNGLSFGVWGVIFNLYLGLSEVGFKADFVGTMIMVNTLAVGLVALPAGLFCERVGLKKALLISALANVANLFQIVILQSELLLFASLVSGLIGTVGWVASAPFMMENSTEEERTHLFSINWALMILVGIVGSYVGGAMPDLLNGLLSLQTGPTTGSALGYRFTLVFSVVLSIIAIIPILLVKEAERERKQKIGDLLTLRNIKSAGTIAKFMIPTALIGFGAGFVVQLFNTFFSLKYLATAEQVGIVFALGNVTLGVGTLAAPALSKKLGKVRSVVACQFLSTPFIMLITLAPNLPLSSFAYVFRGALMNMAGPITLTMQMEMVTEKERATTNGLMVMADNIPRAMAASLGGIMMTGSDFYTPFLVMTITYFVASSLFFLFFRKYKK